MKHTNNSNELATLSLQSRIVLYKIPNVDHANRRQGKQSINKEEEKN